MRSRERSAKRFPVTAKGPQISGESQAATGIYANNEANSRFIQNRLLGLND